MTLGRAICVLSLLACFSGSSIAAAPSVVIVGGGWGPEGNQVSLESQVERLKLVFPEAPVLFAGGQAEARSVQENLPELDETSRVLGLIYDRPENLDVRYRPTVVQGAASSNKKSATQALKKSLRRGDTVAVWVGHGDRDGEEGPSRLLLWGPDDALTAKELSASLARTKGRLGLVLGQCHSGGMTELMYAGGVASETLAQPNRCVLAAVPADRVAAGCTSDVNDPSAKAYVSTWTEALAKNVDHNGDGLTSLAEAHAYAVVNDQTIDLPVRSSDIYLEARLGERAPNLETMSRRQLLEEAQPEQRFVLKSLSSRQPRQMVTALDALAKRLDAKEAAYEKAVDAKEKARRFVLDAVLQRWPELANPLHPVARRVLADEAADVVKLVKGHDAYGRLTRAVAKVERVAKQLNDLEQKEARTLRWLHTAQSVANATEVRRRGSKAWQRAFEALLSCENMAPPVKRTQPADKR